MKCPRNNEPGRLAALREALVKRYGTRVRKLFPIGTVFGRLKIIGYDRLPTGYWAVICACTCGKTKKVYRPKRLVNGSVKSCGCLNRELAAVRLRNRPRTNKLPPGEAAFRSVFFSYRRNAELRAIQFELSLESFRALTTQPCLYCGILPAQVTSKASGRNGTYTYNGIDRRNPAQGYTATNTVASCGTCNRAKHTLTAIQFAEWVERVHTHMKNTHLLA